MPIQVLIVDDSALVRQVITEVLAHERDIVVMGTAADPIYAMEKMKVQWPDVIVLDIEMPRMDGVTFLRQLMKERPTPVVICSSLTREGADVTIQALEAGALGIITKPSLGVRNFLQDSAGDLVQAIRAASIARMSRVRPSSPPPVPVRKDPPVATPSSAKGADTAGSYVTEKMNSPKLSADAMLDAPSPGAIIQTTERIITIGISTGGTQALEVLLPALPRTCPGLAIVQHMPEKFTQSFAQRLDSISQIDVKEAENGDRILPGRALIAPGGKHMMVKRNGVHYVVEVADGPLVSRHRPSVDVLFRSAAKFAGRNATGVIMTGMGDDGARGLKEMRDCGAHTIAQDEASCVVFGMPKEAIRLGAAEQVMALEQIASALSRR